MAMLPSDTSEAAKPTKSRMRMEKCLFGQQELDVPEIMMEDVRFSCFMCYILAFIIQHKELVLKAIKPMNSLKTFTQYKLDFLETAC